MRMRRNKAIVKKIFISKVPESEVEDYINLLYDLDKLNNHNLVKLYDMYRNETYLCIVTEYCAGGDLFTKVKEHGFQYTEVQVGEIILRLICILRDFNKIKTNLKKPKIIHKDIRLKNIYMDENGQPRLGSFSFSERVKIAKLKQTSTHNILFNAPEVIDSYKFSQASDIWSIGVVAYSLLVGHEPFTPRDATEAIKKIQKNEINFYPIEWKKFSKEAYSFVHKCLEPNPDKRITCVEALNHYWMSSLTYENIGIGQTANNSLLDNPEAVSVHLSNAERYNSFHKMKLTGVKGEKISKSGFKKTGKVLPENLSDNEHPFKNQSREESPDRKNEGDALVQKTSP